MAIEERVVYQTSDGETFEDRESAERHEKIGKAAQDAFDNHAVYGKYEFSDDEEFAAFVCKYADMIRGKS